MYTLIKWTQLFYFWMMNLAHSVHCEFKCELEGCTEKKLTCHFVSQYNTRYVKFKIEKFINLGWITEVNDNRSEFEEFE